LQTVEAERKQKRATLRQKRKQNKESFRIRFTRAERFVDANRRELRVAKKMKRASRKPVQLDENEKLILVIRIRKQGETPRVKKILQFLRVRQLHSAAFLKNNHKVVSFLQLAEPFVAWGYPNLETVKSLVYKRGYGRCSGQRVPLSDNKLIENFLGEHNVICTEDIIHELFNVGPAFQHVNKFLWSFKLNPAKGVFIKGTENPEHCGNHKNGINDLIKKMN